MINFILFWYLIIGTASALGIASLFKQLFPILPMNYPIFIIALIWAMPFNLLLILIWITDREKTETTIKQLMFSYVPDGNALTRVPLYISFTVILFGIFFFRLINGL